MYFNIKQNLNILSNSDVFYYANAAYKVVGSISVISVTLNNMMAFN